MEKLQLAKGDSGAMKTLGVAGNEIMRQLERLDQLTVPQVILLVNIPIPLPPVRVTRSVMSGPWAVQQCRLSA